MVIELQCLSAYPELFVFNFRFCTFPFFQKMKIQTVIGDSSLRNKKRPEIATSCNSARRPRSTTRGARQSNFRLDSRPVAVARCLAMLLAHIGPDSQALEQPIRTPSTQNPKAFSFRIVRGSHQLACAPTTPEHSLPKSTDFSTRAMSGLDGCSFTLDNRVRCKRDETNRCIAPRTARTTRPAWTYPQRGGTGRHPRWPH